MTGWGTAILKTAASVKSSQGSCWQILQSEGSFNLVLDFNRDGFLRIFLQGIEGINNKEGE